MSIMGTTLLVVLVLLGARWLWQRPGRRQASAVRALLQDCGGAQALVERLIFRQMENHPDWSLERAAREARVRLRRDRN